MTSAVVILPWPPSALSPNSRVKHRHSTDVRRKYKADAWALAKEAKLPPGTGLAITFHPPRAGRRDLDNMLGSIKYGLDGIAEAVGQDDSEWSLTIRRGDPVKGGQVVVEVTTAEGKNA